MESSPAQDIWQKHRVSILSSPWKPLHLTRSASYSLSLEIAPIPHQASILSSQQLRLAWPLLSLETAPSHQISILFSLWAPADLTRLPLLSPETAAAHRSASSPLLEILPPFQISILYSLWRSHHLTRLAFSLLLGNCCISPGMNPLHSLEFALTHQVSILSFP